MYDEGLDLEEINQRSDGGGGMSQADMFAQMFGGRGGGMSFSSF